MQLENLKVRTADFNDAQALLEYLSNFMKENCNTVPKIASLPSFDEEEHWIKSRLGDKGVIILAELKGKTIGLIETSLPKSPEFKHNCEFGMSVLQEHRNMGIGRKLLSELLNWAEEKGMMRIELNVFSNNLSAIRLYKNMGFKEDGRRTNAVRLSENGYCDLIHMFRLT